MRRIIMPAGLAAGVLVALGVILIGIPARSASAADQLRAMVDANSIYKGWVHIRYERVPAGQEQPDPQPRMDRYVNTADGTSICVSRQRGRLEVDCVRPAERTCSHYRSDTNELRISPLTGDVDQRVRQWATSSNVTTVEEMLATMKTRAGQAGMNIQSSRDAGCDRFDVTWAEGAESSAAGSNTRQATLWADPQSHLIRKVLLVEQGQTWQITTTYGDAVADIYAVGVPRDAKVADTSQQPGLQEALRRLDGRFASGLGVYVAVVTETIPQGPTVPRTQPDTLNLYAQAGDAWLWCQYPIAGTGPIQGAGAGIDRPDGWPLPDAASVVAKLRGVRPAKFLVCDGRQAWSDVSPSPQADAPSLAAARAAFSLGALIWPSGAEFAHMNPDISLLEDAEHPGLVALKVVPPFRDYRHGDIRAEQVHWFDPARNDVLVEKIDKTTNPDGNWLELHTRYRAYAQLPAGLWYPVQWSMTERCGGPGQQAQDARTHRYQLQLVAGMKLDPQWFVPPSREPSAEARPAAFAPVTRQSAGSQVQPELASGSLDEFDRVYRLEDGQLLKRIAPPFIPQRMEYYHRGDPGQAEAIPEGPAIMKFGWGGQLFLQRKSYLSSSPQLHHVLGVLGLARHEYDGPKELLDMPVPGDWIIRDDTNTQKCLAGLEQILRDELKQPVRFERRTVEMDTIVIRGEWQFHPSLDVQPGDRNYVNVYSDAADATDATAGTSGMGTSGLAEMFAIIGDYLKMPVVDERSSRDAVPTTWRVHRSGLLTGIPEGPDRTAKVDLVLKHLAEQTSLQFARQHRPAKVWYVCTPDGTSTEPVAGGPGPVQE